MSRNAWSFSATILFLLLTVCSRSGCESRSVINSSVRAATLRWSLVIWRLESIEVLSREETDDEVDATEAGRGGGAEGVEKLKRDDCVEVVVGAGISFLVPIVVAGRTFGLGVMDPGVPGEKRDFTGL